MSDVRELKSKGVREVLLTAILLATGCGAPGGLCCLTGDEDVSTEDRRRAEQAVHKASLRWEAATGLSVPLRGVLFLRDGDFECVGGVLEGCYDPRFDDIHINYRHPRIEALTLHEWVHHLGLQNPDHLEPGNVFTDYLWDAADCITPEDVAAVCAVQTCSHQIPEQLEDGTCPFPS